MAYIARSISLNVPVRTAYNKWTEFENFPQFMGGIKEVTQIDNHLLHWRAAIAGRELEWDAKIIEQVPDKRITWKSITGATNTGVVKFAELSNAHSLLTLRMEYEPEGVVEALATAARIPDIRIEGDLKRFKYHIESRVPLTNPN